MLLANIQLPETYHLLLQRSVWTEIIDWLKAMPAELDAGIYPLREDESIFVNVHGYTTLPREECRYESHRRFVDLQFIIDGEERIEWCPVSSLEPAAPFNESRDVQHYLVPSTSPAVLDLGAGDFVIFDREDGHMPKGQVDGPCALKKLVVKIDRKYLEPQS